MGGMGKTTLAQVVYNDKKVTDHFDLKGWFCVSEAYGASRITKGLLLQEIGSFDLKVDDNLNQLQVKLKKRLNGGIGSKIIVTTRKESGALMMRAEQISMDTLSIDDSWSLFKRHAFENMDPMGHLELEVGKQIVAK
ncbi:hypothetical protein BC332_28929 [Capsicum chinense]|nr:hypothetical protein BC332_28929 [Capsicum chinense]